MPRQPAWASPRTDVSPPAPLSLYLLKPACLLFEPLPISNSPAPHYAMATPTTEPPHLATSPSTPAPQPKPGVDVDIDLDIDSDDRVSTPERPQDTEDIEKGSVSFFSHPPASTKEPFRDVRGPFTLHRLFIVAWVVGSMVAIYYLQLAIWSPDRVSEWAGTWIASPYWGFLLIISLPSAVLSLVGAMWFRFDPDLDSVPRTQVPVVFRIVSRGVNKECLLETIRFCQAEMRQNSFFPYLVEIVTDADVFEAPDEPDVLQLKVPPDYHTPNGTLFKARALHYACEHSRVPPHTWVVHLDEETRPTSSAIKGIARMVADCERSGDTTRIGQGCILYHRAWERHTFLTLADTRRTGDDFGHFFLQHRVGRTMFGLHGAFIVCRQDAEAAIGFDIGPAGSITEDAWWVLLAMDKGYRTCWVEGFLDEQATQSIMDFLKQRRRWNYGLIKVALLNPAPVKYRLSLAWFILSWITVPFLLPVQLAYTISLIVLNLPIPLYFRIPTTFIFSMQFYVYLVGFVINMREHKLKWWKFPFWALIQILLVPVFLLMEIASVFISFFAGFTTNGKGFHVVQKDATKKVDYTTGGSGSSDDDGLDSSSTE